MYKHSDIKGNPEKAREKGRLKKGKKHKLTKLKDAIGIDRTNIIIAALDKNIEEFTTHPDPAIRLDASKAFLNYYKPKKIEHSGTFTGNINIKFKY